MKKSENLFRCGYFKISNTFNLFNRDRRYNKVQQFCTGKI